MGSYDKTTVAWLKNPWTYVGFTFAWTWLLWSVCIALGFNLQSTAGVLLMLGGAFGPIITGIAFTYLTKNKAGQRDYWQRVVDFKRMGLKWLLIVLLFVPILHGSAALIDLALGGHGAVWGNSIVNFAANPVGLVFSLLFASLIPFVEELGWRGYALDRFQENHSAFGSSLILGMAWSLWHLPLFWVTGTYQAGLGLGTEAFWFFMIGIVPLSFAFTWVYNNTQRSILAAFLLHAMVNFTGELFDIIGRANNISIYLWMLVAIGITIFGGSQTFTGQPKQRFDRPKRQQRASV